MSRTPSSATMSNSATEHHDTTRFLRELMQVSPFRIPAHYDLRAYARVAKLPPMELSSAAPALPQPGHRSHANALAVEWDDYRRLELMYTLVNFQLAALRHCELNLPAKRVGTSDIDEENGGGISISANGFTAGWKIPIGKPADAARVARWVLEYPLATVSHMMHLVYPESADFKIKEGFESEFDGDGKILRWATWALDSDLATEVQDTWTTESVVIVMQPPWILSAADLQAFVAIPKFSTSDPRRTLKSSERLWGKIWDLCYQKHSHWFVLTSYWGWVFGCFSPRTHTFLTSSATDLQRHRTGRTRAFTSCIIPYDSAGPSPTVLQCLFFWFSSALIPLINPNEPWIPPEVSEDDAFDDVQWPCTYQSICRMRKRMKERDALLALALTP
ncbi:hypothetical protein FKP32DRAFT_1591758 [Trametes sanguinea]|nr:hypothetical protein FKP32DRAFT_1591758 [Trametes sanguinea]